MTKRTESRLAYFSQPPTVGCELRPFTAPADRTRVSSSILGYQNWNPAPNIWSIKVETLAPCNANGGFRAPTIPKASRFFPNSFQPWGRRSDASCDFHFWARVSGARGRRRREAFPQQRITAAAVKSGLAWWTLAFVLRGIRKNDIILPRSQGGARNFGGFFSS